MNWTALIQERYDHQLKKFKYGTNDAKTVTATKTVTNEYNEIIKNQNNFLEPPTGCLQVKRRWASIKFADTITTAGTIKNTSEVNPIATKV